MDKSKISITEFSQIHGVDRIAVSQWLRRHEEVLKDCEMIGKDRYISVNSEGYRLLEDQYPLPAPVQVINRDPEDIAEIIRLNKVNEDLNARIQHLQDLYVQLLSEQAEYARIEAQAESLKQIADNNADRAEKAEIRAEKAEHERDSTRAALENARNSFLEVSESKTKAELEAEDLRKRLIESEIREKEAREQTDRLLNRSLLDRIRNKRV